MEKVYKIVIVRDFSEVLGGRYKSDGPNSGEQFRTEILLPAIQTLPIGRKLLIDLDGSYGYPTSFLEEAFGGLAREIGPDVLLDKLDFKSDEEPSLIEEIKEYIKNARPIN